MGRNDPELKWFGYAVRLLHCLVGDTDCRYVRQFQCNVKCHHHHHPIKIQKPRSDKQKDQCELRLGADVCVRACVCVCVKRQFDVEHVRNVMAHAQKPDLVFQRNGRVHLNRRGCQISRLLAAELCASAVVMLDTPCSEIQCKTTGYPLHSHVFPSLPLPCVTVCHQVSTEL